MDGRVKSSGFDPKIIAEVRALIEQHMPGKTVTHIEAVTSYDVDADKSTTRMVITLES